MKKKQSSPHHGSLALLRETLRLFLEKDIPADRALNEIFRKHKLREEQTRSELARRFYGIIRYWRPLVNAIGADSFETVNEIRGLVETYNAWRFILRGEEPSFQGPVADRLKKYARIRIMRESLPDWLDTYAVEQLGETHWEKLAQALNEEPKIFLRVNTLKTDRDQLVTRLREENVPAEPVAGTDQTLLVKRYVNVFGLASYKDGWFEVQDYASQFVAPFVMAEPGMRVADCCAGNGGKTLHLAALMKNKGRIVAMDVSEKKLQELRNRCSRNGVDLVEIKTSPAAGSKLSGEGSFDRVLLDVPCSGSGVLRRNPDIRWRLQPEDLSRLIVQQQEILRRYAPLVKAGGMLVYATCSVFPSEGEMQVKTFLQEHADAWILDAEMRIDPVSQPGDGFYMARIKKISP